MENKQYGIVIETKWIEKTLLEDGWELNNLGISARALVEEFMVEFGRRKRDMLLDSLINVMAWKEIVVVKTDRDILVNIEED